MLSKQSWRQNMTSGFLAETSELCPRSFPSALPWEHCSSFPQTNHSRPIIWIRPSRRSNQGLQHTLSVSVCVAVASWVMSLHHIIWRSSGCATLQSWSVSDIDVTVSAPNERTHRPEIGPQVHMETMLIRLIYTLNVRLWSANMKNSTQNTPTTKPTIIKALSRSLISAKLALIH